MNPSFKKPLIVGFFILLALILFLFFQSNNSFQYETSPDGKVIYYGTSADTGNVQQYEQDCADRDGTLLTCTSPPGNITAVCYYGCQLP